MLTNEVKPLHPISDGIVLVVGVKASNIDQELRDHPRVIIWDNQSEHWMTKEIPSNTRAVFVTRFISHSNFSSIMKQARKRRITMFNPEGTGMIMKQVRELLDIRPKVPVEFTVNYKPGTPIDEMSTNGDKEMIPMTPNKKHTGGKITKKLDVFIPFIDWNKSNADNARALLEKAKELNVETTLGSLNQFVMIQRRRQHAPKSPSPQAKRYEKLISRMKKEQSDVSVQMFDNAIRELRDMRQLFIDTMKENKSLRARLNKFRTFFDE